MPRIQPIQITESKGESRQLLEKVQRCIGMVPNLLKTMAHSPAVLGGYLDFNDTLEQALNPALREQIALTVAGINHCNYCASAHTAFGVKAGIDTSELARNLMGESGDNRTRAVLQFARAVVLKHGRVRNEDLSGIRVSGFGDQEIAEIIAIIALNLFTNYFNHIAGTDLDFPVTDTSHVPYRPGFETDINKVSDDGRLA